jgi:hypothetical protein
MKHLIRYTLYSLLVLVTSVLPAMAASITYAPLTQTVNLGTHSSVDIMIDGLGNGIAPALSAYDLTVFFDPSILLPTTVSFSTRLGDTTDPLQVIALNQFVFVGSNIVGVELLEASFLDANTLFALQNTSSTGLTLATIGFDTIGVGTSSLRTFVASAADENGNPLTLGTTNGSITVNGGSSQVPEPGTVVLLGSGLALLIVSRRRRKQ